MDCPEKDHKDGDFDDFSDFYAVPRASGRKKGVSESHTRPEEIEIEPPEPSVSAPAPVRVRSVPISEKKTENYIRRTESREAGYVTEYSPENSLIHKVRIYSWQTNYSYYEQFCRVAARVDGLIGRPAPYVPFFSYMPQYSQLTESQFSYYLWFREELRHGTPAETDYSYILLYIYELINLSDQKPAEEILSGLTDIWVFYRAQFPRLDVQLSDWICDFCLINGLRPDFDRLASFGAELIRNATLKEFYVDTRSGGDVRARLLMTYCSNYDYTKSKFATGDARALYAGHMTGVVSAALESTDTGKSSVLSSGLQDSRVSRDAYTGALCSPKIKKRIEIEYTSFSHSHELRFKITDLLKYSENKIRAYLGIKSRLSCSGISAELKKTADEYFDKHLPQKAKTHSEPEAPAYERFYEPLSTGFSYENASVIEKESWDTTDKLLEAFSDSDQNDGTEPEVVSALSDPLRSENINPEYESGEDQTTFTAAEILFLAAAVSSDAEGQRAAAGTAGKLPDAMADAINEKALAILGDIVLQDNGNTYSVIVDYEEEVKTWIS